MDIKIRKGLEFIQEFNNQDIRVALRYKLNNGEMVTTKWKDTFISNWDKKYPGLTPNYRQVLDNELVLESDLPTREENKVIADKIINILEAKNINYWCIFTGSKSYHIHIIFKLHNSEKCNIAETKRNLAKRILPRELYDEVDEANFFKIRLIQIEGSVNPKTGNMSEKYTEKINGVQPIIKGAEPTVCQINMPEWKKSLAPEYCAELEYMMEHYVKDSSKMTRHHMILPSFAAYVRNKPNRAELIRKFCEVQKKDPSEIDGWDSLNTYFGHKQIREYFKENGLEHISVQCLLSGGHKDE